MQLDRRAYHTYHACQKSTDTRYKFNLRLYMSHIQMGGRGGRTTKHKAKVNCFSVHRLVGYRKLQQVFIPEESEASLT